MKKNILLIAFLACVLMPALVSAQNNQAYSLVVDNQLDISCRVDFSAGLKMSVNSPVIYISMKDLTGNDYEVIYALTSASRQIWCYSVESISVRFLPWESGWSGDYVGASMGQMSSNPVQSEIWRNEKNNSAVAVVCELAYNSTTRTIKATIKSN